MNAAVTHSDGRTNLYRGYRGGWKSFSLLAVVLLEINQFLYLEQKYFIY